MKSKKLKSKTKRRDHSWSSTDDSRSKRSKLLSKKKDKSKEKTKDKKKEKMKETNVPRKSRWQAAETGDSSKIVPPVPPESGPPQRIRDILQDREKIVDLLFQTVPEETLQKLIPDFLQKKSKEELKKLCLEQIKLMTDEVILQVISGKELIARDEEKPSEKEKGIKVEKLDTPPEKEVEKILPPEKIKKEISTPPKEQTSCDVLELHTNLTELENMMDEEHPIPVVIKDEVAKALITPERDAELLELEMRARAIRALLKARSKEEEDEES